MKFSCHARNLSESWNYSCRLHLLPVERDRAVWRQVWFFGMNHHGQAVSWDKVRGIPNIVEKSQEGMFSCLPALYARMHLPAPFNKILGNKDCLSCVAGKIHGGAKLSVSCIPAKLGSFEKYIFRQSKEWIVPTFYKNPNPLSSTCQINLSKESFLTTPQIIWFLLTQFPRRRLRGLTEFLQIATFQNIYSLLHFVKWLGKSWSRNTASLLWPSYGVTFYGQNILTWNIREDPQIMKMCCTDKLVLFFFPFKWQSN